MRKYGLNSMELNGVTDLDRLHAVVSMENPGRGAGRTFAQCHTVAGVMETTEDGGVICVVPKYDRISEIIRIMFFKVFMDHGIHFHKTLSDTRFIFCLPDKREKQIVFAIPEDDTVSSLAMIGNVWPLVEFTEYELERGADNWKNRVPLV